MLTLLGWGLVLGGFSMVGYTLNHKSTDSQLINWIAKDLPEHEKPQMVRRNEAIERLRIKRGLNAK